MQKLSKRVALGVMRKAGLPAMAYKARPMIEIESKKPMPQ